MATIVDFIPNFLRVSRSKTRRKRQLHSVSDENDIVIHIGAPKSGSSAIQKFCVENRTNLAKNGYYYPEHSLDMNGVSGGHSKLGLMLIEGDFAGAKKLLQQWLDAAKRENQCLLLSGESFYDKAEDIANLIIGKRVKIVAYFRSPISALVSNYNQAVKRHSYTKSLGDFIFSSLDSNLDRISGNIFKLWVDKFGINNVLVFPYVNIRSQPHAIELDFLGVLNVSNNNIKDFSFNKKPVNTSYSIGALELKRQLNIILIDAPATLHQEIDWCLQKYSDDLYLPAPQISELITFYDIKQLVRKFYQTNKFLKENILAYCPDDFFSEEFVVESNSNSKRNEKIPLTLLIDAASSFDRKPETKENLKTFIFHKLKKRDEYNLTLFRIADILGIPYSDPNISKFKFNERQIGVISSSSSQVADICRETALALEEAGEHIQALIFIKKALECRPKGPAIQKIYNRLIKYEKN